MDSPSIDPRFYSVAAWRRQVSWIGRWLYYLGAAEWYLDYQRWKIRFRWGHPLVWGVLAIALLASACAGAYRGLLDGIHGIQSALAPAPSPETSLQRSRFPRS